MGKAKAVKQSAATAPESVEVCYDLFDLPTAFHKAGLAGLILQLRSMERRGILADHEVPPEPGLTSMTIRFTESLVNKVFDDVYDAKPYRSWVRSKWAGQEPVASEKRPETDKATGKTKEVTWYAYDVIQPSGECLRELYPPMPENKGWHKLWRDMLWAIPRGNPQSRQPFEQRAADPAQPCKEGPAAWAALRKAQATGWGLTGPVASSLWPGAQAENAERAPFEGRVEHNLLLHFWPLTVLVFVPDRFKAKQQGGEVVIEYEPPSYSLAVPDVADLKEFIGQYPKLAGGLNGPLAGEDAVRGFRPARAVIDMPEEGALALMEHMAWLLGDRVQRMERLKRVIHTVEFIHLAKEGNNIKTLAAGRVAPTDYLLDEYEVICPRDPKTRPYHNPLFRRALIRALLDNQPWYKPFGKLFAEWDVSFFVPTDHPPSLSWFWADARKKLQEVIQAMPAAPHPNDPPPDSDDLLLMLIHRLTRTYLAERAKRKSGVDPEKFKEGDKINWEKLPKDYYDARRAVGESLFLEFRSRRDQAFIDHFAQTFFAAKQYVSEDQYSEIGHALLRRAEDVKVLTLMALSANS